MVPRWLVKNGFSCSICTYNFLAPIYRNQIMLQKPHKYDFSHYAEFFLRVDLLCNQFSSHIWPLENEIFTHHLNYKELFLGNRIRFPKRTTPLWHCQSENVYLSLFQHGLRPRQTTFQQLFVRCDLLAWNFSDELDTIPSWIFGYLV